MDTTDYQTWGWELVATVASPRVAQPLFEAWVTEQPGGWYSRTDSDHTPHGPYADYATAVRVAKHRIGLIGS